MLVGAGPSSKRPAAPARTHLALDTVAKAPAAATRKAPTNQPISPTATLVAVAAGQLAAAPTAPQVIKLKGIVRTTDGQPCPRASVYPAGAPRQLVVTDANGRAVAARHPTLVMLSKSAANQPAVLLVAPRRNARRIS